MRDEKTGFGKKTNANGEVYEGGFKENYYDGKGKLTWPNGAIYEGNFK